MLLIKLRTVSEVNKTMACRSQYLSKATLGGRSKNKNTRGHFGTGSVNMTNPSRPSIKVYFKKRWREDIFE